MTNPGEAYVLLGLRLGRHVDGLVDSYYGPPELKAEVDAEPLSDPSELVAQGDAALMIHEDGTLVADAEAYVRRWALASPEEAAHSVRFVVDPTWRAYVINYSAGRGLCEAWVGGDPGRLSGCSPSRSASASFYRPIPTATSLGAGAATRSSSA